MCSFHEGALTASSGPDPSTLPIPSAELLRVADGALIGSSRTEDPDDSSADRIRSALASDDIHSFSRSFGVPLYLTPPPDLLPPGRAARNWRRLLRGSMQRGTRLEIFVGRLLQPVSSFKGLDARVFDFWYTVPIQ